MYIYKYYVYKNYPDHIEFIKKGTKQDVYDLEQKEPSRSPYVRLWTEDGVVFEDFGSYSAYYIYSENELTEDWKRNH